MRNHYFLRQLFRRCVNSVITGIERGYRQITNDTTPLRNCPNCNRPCPFCSVNQNNHNQTNNQDTTDQTE